MEYKEIITLKDGRTCVLRNGTGADAQGVLDNFIRNHRQTDFLTTYPDEITFTVEGEAKYLQAKSDSPNVSIDEEYWGLGMGRALTRACIELAKQAGYVQLELQAGADNAHALALYESEGFTEYGRNPRGFYSRLTGWQALVLMRRELDE